MTIDLTTRLSSGPSRELGVDMAAVKELQTSHHDQGALPHSLVRVPLMAINIKMAGFECVLSVGSQNTVSKHADAAF